MNETLTVTGEQVSEAAADLGQKILLFSSYIVNWILNAIDSWGFTLQRWQVTPVLIFIDAVLIWVAFKFVAQPVIKIVMVLALLWFLAGFFVPLPIG